MPKLTEKEIQQKVFQNTLGTCDYISGYETASSIIKIKCRKHNCEIETKWENVRRANRAHCVCPICIQENLDEKKKESRVEVECAYCHQKFLKLKSKLENSKSGLYFCCREHKDLAQRVESGEDFDAIRPDHYNNGIANYRDKALREYPHKCAICNFDEDVSLLEVHHIDENRQNNNIDNLIILCPICHKKLTTKKYELINREKILKKDV